MRRLLAITASRNAGIGWWTVLIWNSRTNADRPDRSADRPRCSAVNAALLAEGAAPINTSPCTRGGTRSPLPGDEAAERMADDGGFLHVERIQQLDHILGESFMP